MNTIRVGVTKYADRENLVLWYRDPISEKIRTRSARTVDQKEAERAAARWEEELKGTGGRVDSSISWADFKRRYEDEHLIHLSANTRHCFQTASSHLERILDPAKLKNLDTAALTTLSARLKREGMNPVSIGAYLSHLRIALRWAHRLGLTTHEIHIQMPRGWDRDTKMRSRPITEEEYRTMLRTVPAVRHGDAADWIRFLDGLWLSGLRLEEAVNLHWSDPPISVDLSGRFPRLRILAEGQKRRKDQFLPLAPDFGQWLQSITATERAGYVFRLSSQGNHAGTRICVKWIGDIVSQIGRKADILVDVDKEKYATAHDFRRAFGTRWAMRVKPAILQQLMRHKTIQTTLNYYVALDCDDVMTELAKSAAC